MTTNTDHSIWLNGVWAQAKRTLNVLDHALATSGEHSNPVPPTGTAH